MQTAATAYAKGYKYLSTPLMALDISYAENFIERACGCSYGQCACTDASCGCPVYIGFHWYAFDCRPHENGYSGLQQRLDDVKRVMELYPFIKGAIVNEVGMLNCNPTEAEPICIPDSGLHPASEHPYHRCPVTAELPNGMASFVEQFMEIIGNAKTNDGKPIVKAVSWFNQDQEGGTYNLSLFDAEGRMNNVGEAYVAACQGWADKLVTQLATSRDVYS